MFVLASCFQVDWNSDGLWTLKPNTKNGFSAISEYFFAETLNSKDMRLPCTTSLNPESRFTGVGFKILAKNCSGTCSWPPGLVKCCKEVFSRFFRARTLVVLDCKHQVLLLALMNSWYIQKMVRPAHHVLWKQSICVHHSGAEGKEPGCPNACGRSRARQVKIHDLFSCHFLFWLFIHFGIGVKDF
jgi:hypothetical protein